MFRKGKTNTSLDSPEFFHIGQVPLIDIRKNTSNKLLRPDLKLSSSAENPLAGLYPYKEKVPKPLFNFEDIMHSSNELSGRIHKNTGKHLNSNWAYSISHRKALYQKSFNKEKNTFTNQFDHIQLTRNSANQISILQHKIQNLTKNKSLLSFPLLSSKSPKILPKLSKISEKSQKKLEILSKEIADFEKKLFKF